MIFNLGFEILTHVILLRLSREDCLLVVLEIRQITSLFSQNESSCGFSSQHIQGLLEACLQIKGQW